MEALSKACNIRSQQLHRVQWCHGTAEMQVAYRPTRSAVPVPVQQLAGAANSWLQLNFSLEIVNVIKNISRSLLRHIC